MMYLTLSRILYQLIRPTDIYYDVNIEVLEIIKKILKP